MVEVVDVVGVVVDELVVVDVVDVDVDVDCVKWPTVIVTVAPFFAVELPRGL